MPRVPETVKSQFHDFCERCPLCDIVGEQNDFCACDEVYARESIVTCSYYNFCGRMAKAVNDGLVDMKTKNPAANT